MHAYPYPLLTDEDLAELTGYTRPSDQMEWLRRNGVRYIVRRDGRPRTTWGAVEEAIQGKPSDDGYVSAA